jgi:ABC-2 type transport system ATP-binding protein
MNPIRLRALRKSFGRKVAVDSLTLDIGPDQIYGLIGPNGAGKTTTFSMMAGYLHPSSGDIAILGCRPGDVAALRNRVGVLPQDALLPAQTRCADLLSYFGRLQGFDTLTARQLAVEALERVGLPDAAELRCGTLSHGMAKRIGIAQAFLGNPELVLLDEPTAGLDPKHAHQIRDLIRQQRRAGRCIVISSHNLHELESLCDAAAILDHGRLVLEGTMATLTGSSRQIRIQLLPGAQPELDALRRLPQLKSANFDATNACLEIEVEAARPEELITAALGLLIAQGLLIAGVSKGDSLEAQVMKLI